MNSVEECYKFFEDACTIKEVLEIAQRLKAAKMLRKGVNYAEITKETGLSQDNVYQRLSRGKRKLKEVWGKKDER